MSDATDRDGMNLRRAVTTRRENEMGTRQNSHTGPSVELDLLLSDWQRRITEKREARKERERQIDE